RDVHPAAAGRREAAHRGLELVGLGIDELVGQVLSGLLGEERMDDRRAAVMHRMADERVAVGGRGRVHRRISVPEVVAAGHLGPGPFGASSKADQRQRRAGTASTPYSTRARRGKIGW